MAKKEKKNEIMLFAAIWMDLEIIVLSEVSQRKTMLLKQVAKSQT